MTDDELVRGFEACTLDDFPHASHVRVAWCYLQRDALLVALPRFRAALQRFAASKGMPGRYHETITVAYMLLIADRLRADGDVPWEVFAARHPELLATRPSILSRYYDEAVLASARARETFVLPVE